MSVKIQINSLEALERLIGGDNEVEYELRQWIVTEFTKKYLKPIATEKYQSYVNQLLKEVNVLFTDNLGNWKNPGYYYSKFEFKPEIKAALDAAIKDSVGQIIKNAVEEYVASIKLEERIQNEVNRHMESVIKAKIAEGVQDRLREISKQIGG